MINLRFMNHLAEPSPLLSMAAAVSQPQVL